MNRNILFTGHMIDAGNREQPRFPAYKEVAVRKEIRRHLFEQKEMATYGIQGIASAACGGDIIFS